VRVKEASEHVFCFFRSIDGLPQQIQRLDIHGVGAGSAGTGVSGRSEQVGQKLVKEILDFGPDPSAREFADQIQKILGQTPKATPEEEVVSFVRQVLVDFTGPGIRESDEKEGTVDEGRARTRMT